MREMCKHLLLKNVRGSHCRFPTCSSTVLTAIGEACSYSWGSGAGTSAAVVANAVVSRSDIASRCDWLQYVDRWSVVGKRYAWLWIFLTLLCECLTLSTAQWK